MVTWKDYFLSERVLKALPTAPEENVDLIMELEKEPVREERPVASHVSGQDLKSILEEIMHHQRNPLNIAKALIMVCGGFLILKILTPRNLSKEVILDPHKHLAQECSTIF